MGMNRAKLDTAIEREVHKYVRDIKEHMYDFTHLYVRRNGIEVDRAVLEKVLEIAKLAIDDGELSKIGMFHSRLKVAVDEFAGEENPTQPTPPQPTTVVEQGAQQQSPKRLTFNL